jgi:glycosidase
MNGSPIPIPCSPGASLQITPEDDHLHLDFTAPGIDQAAHRLFLAIDSGTDSGSSILPYGQHIEGSTVFLPFSAGHLFSIVNLPGAPAVSVRTWLGGEWSPWSDASPQLSGTFSKDHCSLTLSLSGFPPFHHRRHLALELYAKDLSQNDGWGRLVAAGDPAFTPGPGDQYIPGYTHLTLGQAPAAEYLTRLQTPSRVRIYQLLVRLFGNVNETRAVNGTLAQNGSGKFDDINDTAIDAIRDLGCTHIWLTGVLRQATATDYSKIGLPADDPDLLKGLAGSPYAIKDYFDVCPDYARDPVQRLNEFKALLDRIHSHGLKAIIDLVPNHVARSYHSTVRPDLSFGEKDDPSKFFDPNNNFFYLRPSDPGGGPPLRLPTVRDGQFISPTCKVLGAGDGLFEPEKEHGRVSGNNVVSWSPGINDWYETVKLNYGLDFTRPDQRFFPHAGQPDAPIPDTWRKMDEIITYWQAMGVDGFRCDMAHMVPPEFWAWAIRRARARQPDVWFMAEAYNDDPQKLPPSDPVAASLNNVMFSLLNAGFNAVYDDPSYKALKAIYDGPRWANDIDSAITSDFIYQNSLRYAENHDEVRLAGKHQWGDAGMQVGRPVAAILYGIGRGPLMLYSGQEVGEAADGVEGFGGDDARTTIFDYWSMPELVKWVNHHEYNGALLSKQQKGLRYYYSRLLTLAGEPGFRFGGFRPLNPANGNSAAFGDIEGDPASGHWMYAFLRYDPRSRQRWLVVANLHPTIAFSSVHIHIPSGTVQWLNLPSAAPLTFTDRLHPPPPVAPAPGASPNPAIPTPRPVLALAAAPADLPTAGLVIPKIPPLSAMYLQIEQTP